MPDARWNIVSDPCSSHEIKHLLSYGPEFRAILSLAWHCGATLPLQIMLHKHVFDIDFTTVQTHWASLVYGLTWQASLTMLEQALANVMNLGLNCRQVIGPVCFPSNRATFIPLSAFHTWIFPSSEPELGRHLIYHVILFLLENMRIKQI